MWTRLVGLGWVGLGREVENNATSWSGTPVFRPIADPLSPS
jgi:hypothetical protein